MKVSMITVKHFCFLISLILSIGGSTWLLNDLVWAETIVASPTAMTVTPGAISVRLIATPTTAREGETINLSWETSGVEKCGIWTKKKHWITKPDVPDPKRGTMQYKGYNKGSGGTPNCDLIELSCTAPDGTEWVDSEAIVNIPPNDCSGEIGPSGIPPVAGGRMVVEGEGAGFSVGPRIREKKIPPVVIKLDDVSPIPQLIGVCASSCIATCSGTGTECVADCNKKCLGEPTCPNGVSNCVEPSPAASPANTCINTLVNPAAFPIQLNGFAAPFARSNKSLQMGVFCDAKGTQISIGDGSELTYIKRTMYVASDKGEWAPVSLAGEGVQDMSWVKGSAHGNLPTSTISTGVFNFTIAYICHWENNAWACGCSDSTCDNNRWNIQVYQRK